jgi:hypothetical protein
MKTRRNRRPYGLIIPANYAMKLSQPITTDVNRGLIEE